MAAIRDPQEGWTREEYWRHYKFGYIASPTTLESRHTGRDEQTIVAEYMDDNNSDIDTQEFINTVVVALARDILSGKMEGFLTEELAESVTASRRWRIIQIDATTGNRGKMPLLRILRHSRGSGILPRLRHACIVRAPISHADRTVAVFLLSMHCTAFSYVFLGP